MGTSGGAGIRDYGCHRSAEWCAQTMGAPDVGGGFGDSIDDATSEYANTESVHHEERQDAVDGFRRNVHQQADEPERPDTFWDCSKPGGLCVFADGHGGYG